MNSGNNINDDRDENQKNMNKLILILITVAVLFGFLLSANSISYKTLGINERFYMSQNGLEIECDINLLQKPVNCKPIFPDDGFPDSKFGSATVESGDLLIDRP